MDSRYRFLNATTAGSLSGLDLLFNFFVEVPWARFAEIIGRAGDNPAVSIGITLLANSTAEFQLFGQIAQWGLYLYLVYSLSPALFPEAIEELAYAQGTRFLMTASTCGMLAIYSGYPGFFDPGSFSLVGLTIFAGSICFGGYFRYLQQEPFHEEKGYAYLFYAALGAEASDDEEATIDPTADSWTAKVSGVVLLGLAGALLTFCCILTGMLLYVIGLFFPLLEMTVLGWVVYESAVTRFGLNFSRSWKPDIETSFVTSLKVIFQAPLKGLSFGMLIIVGLTLSVFPFLFVAGVLTLADASELMLFFSTSRGLSTLSLLAGVFVFSIYGLWYWFLIARQVPALVSNYSQQNSGITSYLESPLPRGYMIPATPAVLAPAMFSLGNAAYLHYAPQSNMLPFWIVTGEGLLMIPIIGYVLAQMRRTYRQSTGSVYVSHLPTGGFCTQAVTVAITGVILINYDRIKTAGIFTIPELPGYLFSLWPVPIILISLYYLPDARRYNSQESGIWGKILLASVFMILNISAIAASYYHFSTEWTLTLSAVFIGSEGVILWTMLR